MDFQLYSLGAALVFHEIFFPESSTAMALILAMGTYGAGYVARIVGAFIFGKMGDRTRVVIDLTAKPQKTRYTLSKDKRTLDIRVDQ